MSQEGKPKTCKAPTRTGAKCKNLAVEDGLCKPHSAEYRESMKGNERAKKLRPTAPDEHTNPFAKLVTKNIDEDIRRQYWLQAVLINDIKAEIGSHHPTYATKINSAATIGKNIVWMKQVKREMEREGEGITRVEVVFAGEGKHGCKKESCGCSSDDAISVETDSGETPNVSSGRPGDD